MGKYPQHLRICVLRMNTLSVISHVPWTFRRQIQNVQRKVSRGWLEMNERGARRILTTTVFHGHSEYMESEVWYTGYTSLGKSLKCSETQLHHLHNGNGLTHLIRK